MEEVRASGEVTNGFHLVVEALRLNGVSTIYGVAGIPITDLARIAQSSGIRYIGFRHEEPAGHAAAIAGYLTQRPGVCLTVSAPGFLNGMVALANATTNCFPLIQISGSSERGIVDLQQGAYEELDQLDAARPYTKAAYRVDDVEGIGLGVARAIRAAVSGRPGGVYLDLPGRVLAATMDAAAGRSSIFQVVDPAPRQIPSPESVTRALDLLGRARRPLVLLGKGAAYARADETIREFIEASRMPFLPMSMAKGILPDDHPQAVVAARSLALKSADVVMLVGARLNWLLSHGQPPHFAPDARFVQVDISPTEFDSNRPIAAPVMGDIASVMVTMLRALRPGSINPDRAWLDELAAKKKQNVAKMRAHLAGSGGPMNFYAALGAIRNVLAGKKGVFIVNEGANTLDFGRDVLDMYEPRKRLDCGTWGVMGVGMGYAIAAAVETGRPVVAVEGDSAFGFSGMEVETICRYKLPIVVVVFNNGGIYRGDDVNRASSDPSPTTLARDGHYEKLIEAFGGVGYDAGTPAALSAALSRALESGAPALINCAIDPTAGTESGHIANLNPKSSVGPSR